MAFEPLDQELQLPVQTFGPESTSVQLPAQEIEKTQQQALQDQIAAERLRVERQESPVFTSAFPRLAEAQTSSRGGLEQTLSTGADLLSLLGRAAASSPEAFKGDTPEEKAQSFLQDLAKTEGTGFVEDILRSPELAASVLAAPISAPLAVGRGLGGLALAGGAEGLASGLVTQGEKVGAGEDFSIGGLAADVALSAAIPGGLKLAGKGIKTTINPILGQVTEDLTKVSEEALRLAKGGFGKGAKQLKEAAGSAREISDQLLNVIDNPEQFQSFKGAVDQALVNTPAIKTDKVISSLKNSIKSNNKALNKDAAKAANKTLGGFVERIRARGKELSAEDFRKLRSELDESINFTELGSSLSNKGLKKARGLAQNQLVESAPKEFSETMAKWSKSLQSQEKLKRFLGKTSEAREERVEGFINNLFGKNKSNRQEIIKEIDNIFGENFSEKIKLNKLANELGPKGVARIITRETTGRSALGAITGGAIGGVPGATLGVALSSPRLASGLLAGTDVAEKFLGQAKGRVPLGVLGREITGEQ